VLLSQAARGPSSGTLGSCGVRVVVHSSRIEVEAQQHGDEHDRTRQARHPFEHIAHWGGAKRAQSDEDDPCRHRRTRHLQRGPPIVMAKAHPRNHGHRQVDSEHQGGEIGSLGEQVWIAEERSSPEERSVVRLSWSWSWRSPPLPRGPEGKPRKGSTVAGPPFVTDVA
jgi:hypothetical protein